MLQNVIIRFYIKNSCDEAKKWRNKKAGEVPAQLSLYCCSVADYLPK